MRTTDFWKAQSQDLWWKCRARSPAYEHDRRASDIVDVEGSPGEYVDYVKLLQEKDPACLEENTVAYPRLLLEIGLVCHGETLQVHGIGERNATSTYDLIDCNSVDCTVAMHGS